MRQLKREYQGGTADIIIWRTGTEESPEYLVTYSQQGTGRTAERFLEIQSTPDSEIIGVFYGVNEKGGKAVSDLLFNNMLKGKIRVLTSPELEEILCED